MTQTKGGDNMNNSKLLNKKIDESGKKKSYLAEKVGLSRAGFYNCVNNKDNCEFRASQIDILCKELNITSLTERQAIFFAKVGS